MTIERAPVPRDEPLAGRFVVLTREGAEADACDELTLVCGPSSSPRPIVAGVVESARLPISAGSVDLAFARQTFRLEHELSGDRAALVASLGALVPSAPPAALHVYAPDTSEGNRLAAAADGLLRALGDALAARGVRFIAADAALRTGAAPELVLFHVLALGPERVWAGRFPAALAPSLAVGGRQRMRVDSDRPSRASRKVEEALFWLGHEPEPGERCVDLGAAPGGWTWSLVRRRCSVIAVDPARLRPDIERDRHVRHVQDSAFRFEPDEPVDWLFCDMAWRPLEVAQLLAKWGRRRWARHLVANVKLPMKKKATMVEDVRSILIGGGWTRVRARQLYHDRDEVTFLAIRR